MSQSNLYDAAITKPNHAPTVGHPRISTVWLQAITDLMFNEGINSPTEIYRRLVYFGEQHNLREIPSLRTVHRYMGKLRNKAFALKTEPFRWPDSMGTEEHQVPWEASRESLNLLRWCLIRGSRRPTVRMVQWFWRVCQATQEEAGRENFSSNDAIKHRLVWAARLSVAEIMEHRGLNPSIQGVSLKECLELEVTFQPESSDENSQAFETALRNQGVPLTQPQHDYFLDYGDRKVSALELSQAATRYFQRTKKFKKGGKGD